MNTDEINKVIKSNQSLPQSATEAKAFIRKIFRPSRPGSGFALEAAGGRTLHFEATDSPGFESCGESSRGVVDLLLKSNLLSEEDRQEVASLISAAQPPLEKSKTIDHFRFAWTEESDSPDDNVTEAEIDLTGIELNRLFELYSNELKAPKSQMVAGNELIDVEVYYDSGLYGSTSSESNKIFLNSRDVVRDSCRRKTTCAHELFHRVQYEYGFVTGTADQAWWVEGLGSWSQKYAYPDQQDYVRRIISGLKNPKHNLLYRSYDACLFWKYFGERSQGFGLASELQAIRRFLELHESNGRDAKSACAEICEAVYPQRPFDNFFGEWVLANYSKDLQDAPHGYLDNEIESTSCGRTWGPFPQVEFDTRVVVDSVTEDWATPDQTVPQYGTNYHEIRFQANCCDYEIKVTCLPSTSEFSVGKVKSKDGRFVATSNSITNSEVVEFISPSNDGMDQVVIAISRLSVALGRYRISIRKLGE